MWLESAAHNTFYSNEWKHKNGVKMLIFKKQFRAQNWCFTQIKCTCHVSYVPKRAYRLSVGTMGVRKGVDGNKDLMARFD